MKKLSSRALAAVTNGLLVLVLIVVGTVCFFPAAESVSGVEEKAIRSGNSENGVSLMINVYWGTDEVYGILDVLESHNATATFFVGGSWADDNVAALKAIVGKGHEVGSHGYFHRDHTTLNRDQNIDEIRRSVEFISLATGYTVTLFAPPSGAYNDTVTDAAEAMGMKTVLWSKDTVDWRDKDKSVCFHRATNGVKGGDLILMHPMEHTLAALPEILDYYAEHGLKTISVSENIG